jgi:hypothetical protein
MRSLIPLLVLLHTISPSLAEESTKIEKWGRFELALKGPKDGNPFLEVTLSARLKNNQRELEVQGFYDGEGTYRIRFMPDTVGRWSYITSSNQKELDGKTGILEVTDPSPKNHGPVRVRNKYHFAYADGTPYFPIGTTCYAWIHLGDEIEKQTLTTLKTAPFNKVRMCIFPKWYAYNKLEPPRYPFVGEAPQKWDFARFNPEFFHHLEQRILDLGKLGIEADLILFHPYDTGHWGFDRMPAEADDRYLKYVVARLSSFRNVWWSLANEFDFMKEKKLEDWERYLHIVTKSDPYGHLCSIHNGTKLFNHTDQRITHASIQNGSAVADFGRAVLYRDVYEKPIILDEVKYEGDLEQRWGNLSPEEMVHRFWQGTIAGTYVTHGETYKDSQDMIWWSKGGTLRGKSPERIAFLRKVIEDGPREGMEPIDKWQDERTAGKKGAYYLVYFGKEKPQEWQVELPQSGEKGPLKIQAEILDTWNCTITPIKSTYHLVAKGRYRLHAEPTASIPLPGKPYLALRLKVIP